MTRILALDTSTDACSVALLDGEHTLSRYELAARSHTRRLLPMVDDILAEAELTLSDLDALAFGRGPGSFTGLRICLGVVQGLAFARDLPVVGVSTLSAMAVGYYRQHPALKSANTPLLVALDARMHEVYWALLSGTGQPDVLHSHVVEAVEPPSAVAAHPEVQALQSELRGIGAGWHYPELAALFPSQELASQRIDLDVYPNALDMLPLAMRALANGEAVTAEDAQPVYLRDKVSWKKRQRIRS